MFIYQILADEVEEGIRITLYKAMDDGSTASETVLVPYTMYLQKKDYEQLGITSHHVFPDEKTLQNRFQERVLRLQITSKEVYEYLLGLAKQTDVPLYEQDVSPDHRYLIDNHLTLADAMTPLKRLYLDIETLPDKEVIMVSLHNADLSKVIVNTDKIQNKDTQESGIYEVIVCQNEEELLRRLKEEIMRYGPHVIIGWNVIDFDFMVIKERMDKYNIDFSFSHHEGYCHLRISTDFFRDSTMMCPGVLIVDAIHLLKTNFLSYEDYKLNTVSKAVLKDEKIDLEEEENKLEAIKRMYMENTRKLMDYNMKDSILVQKICDKLQLLELMQQRSIITNTPFMKVKSPIATLDIMYLTRLHDRGMVAPSMVALDDNTPIEGAFVIEPMKGFYSDVFVLDFKSLYPSIIMTFNIDPFTISKAGPIVAPNQASFLRQTGILPELIKKLYVERDLAKEAKDKNKSYALKITMNSFYGAMASPRSRYYSKSVGEAITSFGREIIKKAKQFIETKDYDVIYGDTDSIFVHVNRKFESLEEKKNFGKALENALNAFFKDWVKETYGQDNHLHIEMEKIYERFFIATKKRYVGYDQLTEKLQFVGMEAVRGDWTELAKNFQTEIVKLLFSGRSTTELKEYIRDHVDQLRDGKFDDQLIYKKKITKPLAAYTKTTPPHVRAAREVPGFSGRLVRYVVTKDGPKHESLMKDYEIDYDHYVEKQLKGVSDDLLEALNLNFDEIVLNKKQQSLDQFWG